MRARLMVLAFAMMVGASPQVAAHQQEGTDVVWDDALPCATICTWYWVDGTYQHCEWPPFPPGTYEDIVTSPAPVAPAGKIIVLEVTLDPVVDWDLFLCANNSSRTMLADADEHDADCDALPVSGYLVGCHEDASTPVLAGQRVIMRAYNVDDPFPATGRYWFRAI